eukprot:3844729-Pleurochrysis_carterae.AAC.1
MRANLSQRSQARSSFFRVPRGGSVVGVGGESFSQAEQLGGVRAAEHWGRTPSRRQLRRGLVLRVLEVE